ncbi:MAG: S8 family serine peptidase [Xanthomonadales bacterium]|nr:S8 family serine peptidase [Xanthomonadales bacterium]
MLAVALRGSGWMLSLALVAMPVMAADKLSPEVRLAAAAGRPVEVLITVAGDAGLARTPPAGEHAQKVATAGQRLRDTAARAQAGLLEDLESRAIEHRAFWVANVVWARAGLAELERIAGRDDVLRIDGNPVVRNRLPQPEAGSQAPDVPNATEWGVNKVRAPEVWATGVTGQGVVIGGQDTGYQWDHPALRAKYRGWNGTTADHNYNWHDAIHALVNGGVNDCGLDSPVPCDDHNHGTHTMGTMVGDDGGNNQVGVAPGARWIGCRNMEAGDGTPATYLECFQWFMAPTDLAGQNPDPARAPHVINNSWGCPPSEGCTVSVLESAVDNLRAAGVMVVVSAGNNGSSCGSVQDPPAIYARSFSVGNTTSVDSIAGSSSRGPVTIDGSNRLKPDVSAPGSSIRSSIRGGGYANFSGTSMAGPHVAAAAALVMSARPDLRGNPAAVESVLRETAVPLTSTQTCGLYAGSTVPNAVFGSGRIDAYAAVSRVSSDPIFVDGTE